MAVCDCQFSMVSILRPFSPISPALVGSQKWDFCLFVEKRIRSFSTLVIRTFLNKFLEFVPRIKYFGTNFI